MRTNLKPSFLKALMAFLPGTLLRLGMYNDPVCGGVRILFWPWILGPRNVFTAFLIGCNNGFHRIDDICKGFRFRVALTSRAW